ncbi:23S rRNA (adenine2030-N6)-methyltransferase [Stella humosa]|uniref:Ribosomal RNA large subunit methyltransferase J n=1 Tax=Stella humosa TaxID=94 RepID=A0A3N1KZJ9_9PROT|nr:23S rRNA (adenine(2030)-N(6))-methyltransferase RlmJ [Stella humosa]ROP84607.1 23S rRNA (adenine2030-N6)-methyltransferase [Stella humosa]BBK34127.1 ribosomal RNA large subunit methyltransferase J [Stella humosa]
MNYRHAFHAGNHTEVFKHAALVLLLDHLRQKPKPFFVLDTHAGLGLYDLKSPEAQRTGEAEGGIGRVLARPGRGLASYRAAVEPFTAAGRYPGSPAIAAAMMRDGDRLGACELHPEDVEVLRGHFRRDRRVAVHHRDGYEAMAALLPPAERRGLVFVDPPYESRDEATRLGEALAAAWKKWPTGIYACWYPIKDDTIRLAISGALAAAGVENAIRADFLRYPVDGERLAGGGMIFINPPWRFDEQLERVADEWAELLALPATGRKVVRRLGAHV